MVAKHLLILDNMLQLYLRKLFLYLSSEEAVTNHTGLTKIPLEKLHVNGYL